MSSVVYTGTLSPNAQADSTWYTVTGGTPAGSSDLTTLSTEPEAFEANQQVFMNQPLSWWLACMLSGDVSYTPISGEVNWSYKTFQIGRPITDVIIPNRTERSVRGDTSFTIVLQDNNCLALQYERQLPGSMRNQIPVQPPVEVPASGV